MASPADGTNVLLVVLDTVRKDHLSVYGHDEHTTPTLAAFAEEARVYEEAVAPAPWTLPVHASMFTGLYPSEHGATQESPYLEGAKTLAESVGGAGYETACYSSNAWITPYTNLTAGFDRQDNFFRIMPGEFLAGPLARGWKALNDSERLRGIADRLVQIGNAFHERFAAGVRGDTKTPAVIERTIEFVDDADDFFAFINLMDAHLPYHPPAEHVEEFAPGVDSTTVCQNSKDYNSGARDIDDAEWADIRGLYDAEIRHMDAQLERLFDHLKATGRWADTTVIVCADHGELHGDHDLYGHEFCVYDPLVNVPLLVKHPDLAPGRDDGTTVELLDLYHTVLDATNVEADRGLGLDPVRSLLSEKYRDFGTEVGGLDRARVGFIEYHQPVVELNQLERKAAAAGITLDEDSRFYSRMGAARRPDGKFIHNTHIPDEGYLLAEDPGETDNVLDAERAIDALAGALEAFTDEVDATWPDEADGADGEVLEDMEDDAKDRLRDLGYLD